jgi:hypothetical protein
MVESYGDPLFRMPTQSNIPMTADRQYLADALGYGSMPFLRLLGLLRRLSNEAADQLVRADY